MTTTSEKRSKIFDECMAEMFKRVGEKYPNKELTDQAEWYLKRTWTEEEEKDFKVWMINHLKRTLRFNKKSAEWETGMFMLNYGWKTFDQS